MVDDGGFYAALGVSPTASDHEVRHSYMKLARQLHPDKTGGSEAAQARLQAASEAWSILKNPHLRRGEGHAPLSDTFMAAPQMPM